MAHLFQLSPFRPQSQAILPQLIPELQSYVYQHMVTSLGQTYIQICNSSLSQATVVVMRPSNVLKALYLLFRTNVFSEKSLFRKIKGSECIFRPFLITTVPYIVGSPQLLSPGCVDVCPSSQDLCELLNFCPLLMYSSCLDQKEGLRSMGNDRNV